MEFGEKKNLEPALLAIMLEDRFNVLEVGLVVEDATAAAVQSRRRALECLVALRLFVGDIDSAFFKDPRHPFELPGERMSIWEVQWLGLTVECSVAHLNAGLHKFALL